LLCGFLLRARGCREKIPRKVKHGKQRLEAGGKAAEVVLDTETMIRSSEAGLAIAPGCMETGENGRDLSSKEVVAGRTL
jgi:hypothetical protein